MRKSQFYSVQVERNIIRALVQKKNFCKSVLTYNRIVDSHFTDQFCLDSWKVIKAFYKKYGSAPKKEQMKHYIVKYMTFNTEVYPKKKDQIKIWRNAANRLYKKKDVDVNSEYDELEEYRKLRLLQDVLYKGVKNLDVENLNTVYKDMTSAVSKFDIVENVITQGNLIDDLDEHFEIDRQIKSGEFKPVKTNIIGVIDYSNNKPKIIELDNLLLGGVYAKEVLLYVGESNIGKSFALMEHVYSASKIEKENSILFTIEMDKIKAERRAYSRATGIPYHLFKTGQLSKKHKDKLLKWREKWKKDKCGIFEVVSFEKGATVMDIANKVKEVENKYGEPFESISIDYLQDLKPMGKHSSDKDWTALGEISWEVAQLSKYHDNHRGLAIAIASQKKTKDYGKSSTKLGSSQGSALPEHHATTVIGLGQSENDSIFKRIRWDLSKNREGDRNVSFYTYTDFSISRISSIKKIKEYYQNLESNDDEE